jgi:fructose-bisphosphate aldolase class I
MNHLMETARLMLADHKGLEARRRYRELIITTPGLRECISGVILYDETIRQARADGTPFVKIIADSGIITGIKVDVGAKDLAGHAGEKITEGLDGLRERLRDYFQIGARFAKWRAVMRWPATPPFVRSVASFPSSSQKC